jgi:hypothetical protein
MVLWTIGNILQAFLICQPFRSTYDITVKGTCGSRRASYLTIGTFNWITDFFILIIPIPVVWKMQLPRSKKIALTIIFCLGFLYVS